MDKVQDNGNVSSSEDDLCQMGDQELAKEEADNLQANTDLQLKEAIEAAVTTVQEPNCEEIIEDIVRLGEVVKDHKDPEGRQRSRSKKGRRGGQKHRVPLALSKPPERIPVEVIKHTQREVQIVNDDQWEMVPNDIKESKFDKWETSIRGKRCKRGGRQWHNNKDVQGSHDLSQEKEFSGLYPDQIQVVPETPQIESQEESTNQTNLTVQAAETHQTKIGHESPQVSIQKQKPSKQVQKQQSKQVLKPGEPKLNKDSTDKMTDTKPEKKMVEQSSQVQPEPQDSNPENKLDGMSQTPERSASVSSSTTSTLKKKSKKKSVGVENKSDRITSNVKQVLVHDGMLNFTDPGIAVARRLLKKPNDLINEHVS